jgi:hypothetical protein
MRSKALRVLTILCGVVACAIGPPSAAETTCTAAKCADCEFSGPGAGATCKLFAQDGWCECTVIVWMDDTACSYIGSCKYSGGGGTDGGTGGGSSTTCTRLPGAVCPAECESCTTVFWYN